MLPATERVSLAMSIIRIARAMRGIDRMGGNAVGREEDTEDSYAVSAE